jgi:GT2 family glycosyltransferase
MTRSDASWPPASVLISTKDRRDLLDRAVASLARLDYPRHSLEIVVVEETDTPRPLPGVRYVALPREGRGFGYTRNVAVATARHDLVAFTDDDCVVDPGWLKALVRPLLLDPRIAGVAGAVRVPAGSRIGECEYILGFPGGGLKYMAASGGEVVATRALSTCNCAYRKAAIVEAGGFPLHTKYSGEDSLLAERIAARHPCVYTPHAIVSHHPRGTLRGVFAWFVRRGRSQIETRRLVLDPHGHIRTMLRQSWTIRGAVVLAGGISMGRAALPLLGLLAPAYYAAMLWRYRYALRHRRPLDAYFLTPAVKLVMDLGMEWGRITGLWEFRHGRARRGATGSPGEESDHQPRTATPCR